MNIEEILRQIGEDHTPIEIITSPGRLFIIILKKT